MNKYDYIIVGSGIAGLYSALLASKHGTVLIMTKGSLDECNTKYAQGGIAAPVGAGDSPELHMRDTLSAGAGLCNEKAVDILTREAGDRIEDLIRLGVNFDTFQGEIALTKEAAHSMPRILHAGGDATGEKVELTLATIAQRSQVTVLEYCSVLELILENGIAIGVRSLDRRTNTIADFYGRFLVIATGGAGRLYKYTTNPEVATGDGVAVAFRAGAQIMDMEFLQFHPTALRLPGAPPFLLSEALRGEGGILRNINGKAFMSRYDPAAELAPRDIVARSLLTEMQLTSSDHVLLDVTHLPSRQVTTRFPSIYRFCLQHGVDPTKDPIPVAPAAHYMMGGIMTNTWGETSIPGLYACGEAACLGLHGANRLASNSLLETLVFGKRVVERTLSHANSTDSFESEGIDYIQRNLPQRKHSGHIPQPSRIALQTLMWETAGIVRSGDSLKHGAEILASWDKEVSAPWNVRDGELANLVLLSRLVVEAALIREESRGAHYRVDCSETSPNWKKHIVLQHQD